MASGNSFMLFVDSVMKVSGNDTGMPATVAGKVGIYSSAGQTFANFSAM